MPIMSHFLSFMFTSKLLFSMFSDSRLPFLLDGKSDDCYLCHLCEDRLPKFTEFYFQVSCMRDCNSEFDETSVDKSSGRPF
jgi:hypothetical protein